MDTFGNNNFRVTIFGESHGKAVGVVIDGVPAGISLSEANLRADIERRKAGAYGTTERHEADEPQIISGVYRGHTSGSPITIIFANNDCQSGSYAQAAVHPRPGHADWVAMRKHLGFSDLRGGGHFSGRLTLPLVAAGVVAKRLIDPTKVSAELIEMGGESDKSQWHNMLDLARLSGDSLGGIVECVVTNPIVGTGEPFFDSIESVISHAIFSIPGVRGVEFGDGFQAARMHGSEHNDPIVAADGTTSKNGAGGVNGGLANGNPIVLRVAIKPTSSIAREQNSFNFDARAIEPLTTTGRHDVCIALRAAVVVEAAVAIALATYGESFCG